MGEMTCFSDIPSTAIFGMRSILRARCHPEIGGAWFDARFHGAECCGGP
jgi:hypothetical protein